MLLALQEQGVMLAPIDHVEDKVDGKDEQVADHEEPHTRFAGQMCRLRRNVADRVRIRGGGGHCGIAHALALMPGSAIIAVRSGRALSKMGSALVCTTATNAHN